MGAIASPGTNVKSQWNGLAASDHLVQIYCEEETFLASLGEFVVDGIFAGDAVVVIATPAHLKYLARHLQVCGIDLMSACGQGSYIPLDAEHTLAQFMVDGWPDDDRFNAVVAKILESPRREGRRVRAFGEMVALLWADGHKGATVRLEYLWHTLCESQKFSLLCAYPRSGFAKDAAASLHDIFAAHSRVIPG
jgi:hypothetical protein